MDTELTFDSDWGLDGRILLRDERLPLLEAEVQAAEARQGRPAPQRLAYAALHLVLRPDSKPGEPQLEAIDWPATMALRREVAAAGFGIAEAMDTAQRFQLEAPVVARLIEETSALGLPQGFVAGVGSEAAGTVDDRAALVAALQVQLRQVQALGGEAILLPMPQLVRWGCAPQEYVDIYREVLEAAVRPVLIHWLGEMFAPQLAGYFPGDSFAQLLTAEPERVAGAKLSLLDEAREVELRRQLAAQGQLLLSGDDWHFASLIRGAGAAQGQRYWAGRDWPLGDFSHALLGVFDAVYRPAGLGLRALALGELDLYEQCMAPCEALGRLLFCEPVAAYKSGLAFLAYLDGRQDSFLLLGAEQYRRSVSHLLQVADLAGQAGVFGDAAATAARLEEFLAGDLSAYIETAEHEL